MGGSTRVPRIPTASISPQNRSLDLVSDLGKHWGIARGWDSRILLVVDPPILPVVLSRALRTDFVTEGRHT